MAEKKKRVRPTWAQVRQLESRLEEQVEGTGVIVRECDAWREKYRKLKEEYDAIKDSKEAKVVRELQEKIRTLESSNSHMEEELSRLRQQRDCMSRDYTRTKRELNFLLSRGFWDRVFNKMPEEDE